MLYCLNRIDNEFLDKYPRIFISKPWSILYLVILGGKANEEDNLISNLVGMLLVMGRGRAGNREKIKK